MVITISHLYRVYYTIYRILYVYQTVLAVMISYWIWALEILCRKDSRIMKLNILQPIFLDRYIIIEFGLNFFNLNITPYVSFTEINFVRFRFHKNAIPLSTGTSSNYTSKGSLNIAKILDWQVTGSNEHHIFESAI